MKGPMPMSDKFPPQPATVRIDVPKSKLALLDKYGHLDVGKTAELTVTGKVTAIRRDEHGGSIEMTITSTTSDDAGSMKDDLKAGRKSRTLGGDD